MFYWAFHAFQGFAGVSSLMTNPDHCREIREGQGKAEAEKPLFPVVYVSLWSVNAAILISMYFFFSFC